MTQSGLSFGLSEPSRSSMTGRFWPYAAVLMVSGTIAASYQTVA